MNTYVIISHDGLREPGDELPVQDRLRPGLQGDPGQHLVYDHESCDQNERGNFFVFQGTTKTKKTNPFYFLILEGVYFLHF